MKATVLQRSHIVRYEGAFGTLSAFRLTPAPRISDNETTEARGAGELTLAENGDLSLSYREEEGVRVSVKREGSALTVMRGGATLSFVLGEVTRFTYRTAYGELPTEAFCEEITVKAQGKALLLTLTYLAVLGGMAQKNTVRFKITY